MKLSLAFVLFPLVGLASARLGEPLQRIHMQKLTEQANSGLEKRYNPAKLYPEHNFSVPIDHFHNESKYAPHSNGKFPLRYWFDATFYKKGGPVFLFESGEADASSRLPILHKGIMHQLAQGTNGIAVIIEHRYYGTSQPMPNIKTENLRFLTTDQAMADNVYFAQNIKFPGMEHMDLTSHTTPWILYGGSYSGAFVAFSRKLYPDTWWGAISSSGVVKAIYDYWYYYEPVRRYGPPKCIKNTQYLTHAMDNIFMESKNEKYRSMLKKAFNMGGLTHNDDFMSALGNYGVGWWQSKNWDPQVNYPAFKHFCNHLEDNMLKYPNLASKKAVVQKLLKAGGYGAYVDTLTNPMLNWIGFAQGQLVTPCKAAGATLDSCFGTHNASYYYDKSLANSAYLSWPYQYCQQWGFLQTGSGVPANQLPLMSRLVTLEYSTIICRKAFNITHPPDVHAINKHGGYDISYPRLAIIDGLHDPWRGACPHAPQAKPWDRPNTASQPFHMIHGNAVHHWDENGLFPNQTTRRLPPHPVANTQAFELQWVQGWLQEAELHFKNKNKNKR